MTVELVAIGSELLLGQIVDSNSAWIARRLAEIGVDLFRKSTVGDNLARIVDVLGAALERADCVITGGGLGPTEDDLTREAAAAVFGRELQQDSEALQALVTRFRARGFVLTPNNEKQANLPAGARLVHNPNGTAPAFIVEVERGTLICLPGVPFEMKWLIDNEVIPYLRGRWNLAQSIHHRILKVTGMGESAVDHEIGPLMTDSDNPKVGVLAHPGQVDVRISARSGNEADARRLIAPVEAEVRRLLGHAVFGADHDTLESVVGDLLQASDASVASYEDASGGAVADALLSAAGDRYLEGTVCRSDSTRQRLARAAGIDLGATRAADLALAMARAVAHVAGAAYGVAVHSIAPAGSEEMNLARGDTYIAVAGAGSTWQHHVGFGGRGRIDRERAGRAALGLLRHALDPPPAD